MHQILNLHHPLYEVEQELVFDFCRRQDLPHMQSVPCVVVVVVKQKKRVAN